MAKFENTQKDERPYEKLLLYGENTLTESELLSIIIQTGTKENNALQIAQNMLNYYAKSCDDISFLHEISIKELMQIKGVGKITAIKLKAVAEISKRMRQPTHFNPFCIKTKEDIADLFMETLRYEKVEIMKLVMLNHKNQIKKMTTVAIGNTNGITLDIKQILSEPVKLQIPKIIIIHNHPSGDPTPSKLDIIFTQKLHQASALMGIELLEHMIIGDGIYKTVNWKGCI